MSTNQDSFITKYTKDIIQNLQNEIFTNETGLDSTYQFSPLCWLESSFTNYAADISSYTTLEPNAPYAAMLSILRDQMKTLTSRSKAPTPAEVKFIMIVCQLILLVPVHKTSPDVNICLTELLTMRFNNNTVLGEFADIINYSIDKVIVLSVASGSNPIPGLLLVQQEKKNILGLLQSLRIGNHNISAYRCVLGAIIPIMQSLENSLRQPFCVEFYNVLGNFNAEHPAQHHEMLTLSVNQAQMVIDTILGWHSSIEPYELPIMCTLLPFCTLALKDMKENKKSPYNQILKTLGDFKFKKGNNIEGPCFAYLELYAAMSHFINSKNKEVFKPINDFLDKYREKFERTVFTTKDKFLQGKLYSQFLPRYAAIEYLTKGPGNVSRFLFDQSQNSLGWDPMATFLFLTTDGYPLLNTDLIFDNQIFSNMGQRLIESFEIIYQSNETEERKNDAIRCSIAITKYLTQNLKGDPIISALTKARGDPVNDWELTRGLTQFLTTLNGNSNLSKVLCSLIKGIVYTPRELSEELISLILIILSASTFWKECNHSGTSKLIQDLSIEFRQQITDAIRINSQNLGQMPALFLTFLRWSESILINKDKKAKKSKFTDDIRQNFIFTLQLIRGTCGASRAFEISEGICEKIFAAFDLPPPPKFPYENLQSNDVLVQSGIKLVLDNWYNYIKKFTNSKIPAATGEPRFIPSSDRISVMTEFVCRFVDESSIISQNGQNLGIMADHFFNALFAYIGKVNGTIENLSECLEFLNPSAVSHLVKCADKCIIQPYLNGTFNNSYFWINLCQVCAGIAKIQTIPEDVYRVLEDLTPICLSNLQFWIFNDIHQYMKSCATFVKSMYSENVKIRRKQTRWTTTVITITDALMYVIENRPKDDQLIEIIMTMFPTILHGYVFGAGEIDTNTPDIDIEKRSSKDLFYVINSFNLLTKTILTPNLVNYIYASILEILAANPGNGWRHCVVIAESVQNLMKVIFVEAFTEFLGMKYTLISRMNKTDIDQIKRIEFSFQVQEQDPKKKEKEIRAKIKELKALTVKLAQYSRHQRKPTKLVFDLTERKKLIDNLVENDFAFFKNPPTQTVQILASAIRVCAASSHIGNLFVSMTNSFLQSGRQLSGNFLLFYQAFFRAMSDGWKLVPSLRHAINKSVDKFIQSLQPPAHFVYYMLKFNSIVNDINLCKQLFSECFLRPFFTCPMDYEVAGRLRQLDINAFINSINQSVEYTRLMNAILQAEPIYTEYIPTNLDEDREIVLTILGTHSSVRSVLPSMNTEAKATPISLLSIQRSQWMVPAGTTKNGSKLFFIRLSKIPDVEPIAVAANFELQVENINQFELVVFVDTLMPYVKTGFPIFLQNLPEGIIDRISKVYITNVNILALGEVVKIDASKLGEKIVGVEDVTKFFVDDPGVILPSWAIPWEKRVRAYGNVTTPKGATNILMVCENQFVLKSPPASDTPKVFGVPISTYLEIPYNIMTSITIEGDQVVLRYKLPTGAMVLKLKTPSAQLFVNAYNVMKHYNTYELPCKASEVELHSASSIRAECAALGIHLLALRSNYFMTPALHLVETAVRNTKFSPDIVLPAGPIATFTHLFEEIERENLSNEVAPRVAQYMAHAQPSSCISVLPLLTKYINQEVNIEKIARTIDSIIAVSKEDIVLSAINQNLWSNITSHTAITVASAQLIRSDIPGNAVGCILREFVEREPSFMGELLINKILDGTIRRNPYNNGIIPARIFSAIRTLTFEKNDFVESRFAPLVFGCVFGAVHSDQKVVDDIKVILRSASDSLARTHPNLGTGILLQNQTISNLLNHHRDMSVADLVTAGDELCGKLSEEDRQMYRGYISNTESGENPNTWYIKAAAMVQMNGGDTSFVQRFVELMPSLFELEPGHLRLELCFNTLSSLIPKVSTTSLTPIVIVWPALFSVSHQNTHLRCAALKMLAACIDFAYKNGGFRNIGGIESSSYLSTTLIEALGAFRESFCGNLSSQFIYLLVCALRKGFEDIETRSDAIEVAKICINCLKDRQFLATHFLMPLIAFTNEDIVPLAQIFSKKTTMTDILFENFDQRREVDQMFIVAYLENCVADRFCQANTKRIAECLIFGAAKYPSFFRPVMTRVVEKCWRMIDVPSLSIEELDVYATLSANFLSIPDTGVDYSDELQKFQFGRVKDSNLIKIIKKSLNGVERAVKLLN